MDLLYWAIILFLAGLTFAVLEFFVPSGGVLGVSALGCLGASIVLAFMVDRWTGLGFMAGVVIVVPLCLMVGVRWWPHTPLGRRVLLRNPESSELLPDSPLRRELRQLVGKSGVAKSLMMPSGAVLVEDRTIDALSEGLPIEPGTPVRIVEVRGMTVIVRPSGTTPRANQSSDPLSQSVETIGIDPFSDPLA